MPALFIASAMAFGGCAGSRAQSGGGGDTGRTSSDGGAGDLPTGAGALTDGLERGNFLARLSRVFCASLQPCCSAISLPHQLEACATDAALALQSAYQGIASNGSLFTVEAAAACLRAMETYAGLCGGAEIWDVAITLDRRPALAPCRQVLTGTRTVNQACVAHTDCLQTGTAPIDCIGDGDGNGSGRCTVRPPFVPTPPTYDRVGQPCRSELNLEVCFDSCEPGAFCDKGVCAAQRASGSCADTCNLTCTPDTYCTNMLCQPRPNRPTGAPCARNDECAGPDAACHNLRVCGSRLLYSCKG